MPTNYKCLYNVQERSGDYADFQWERNYETVQCLGCENIQFRDRFSHENMFRETPDGGEEPYDESKYFPRNLKNHVILKNIYHLPDKLRIVYIETIEALKNNCYLLAGVGLRTIIEAVCINRNILGRNLEIKINTLVRNKLKWMFLMKKN